MMQTGRPNPYWIAKVINQFGLIPTPPVNGDVFGPGASVAGDIPTFADNTGKLLKDSGVPLQGIFATQTAAAAATIASTVSFVMTAGRATVGDYGAALYKKVGGASAGGFQSADGQWWGLAITTVTPQMFGDCSGECHTFIQGAINYINGINGGTVFFPATTYIISAQINLLDFVTLQGASQDSTVIQANADITVLNCATSRGSQIEKLFFYCSAFPPTNNVVEIGVGAISGVMRDCTIWGGVAALSTSGNDWRFTNIYPTGNTWNIFSRSSNFYTDCKIDYAAGTLPGTATAAFTQASPVGGASVYENQIVDCDFSMPGGATYSILINDGGTNTSIFKCIGSVISNPIVITHARVSMFIGCEIGSTTFTVGTNPTLIDACYAFAATAVSGAGKVLGTNIGPIT